MANTIQVTVKGIPDLLKYMNALPEVATKAARQSINQITQRDAIKLSREEILKQVNFPAGYLDDEKLRVTQKATDTLLEAIITARQRPTSLARFALPGQSPESTSAKGAGGVAVMVKPGHVQTIKSGFLVRLKKGASLTADQYNLGLAVNARNAAQFLTRKSKFTAVEGKNGLYVLYGPSVDQVFADVAAEISPELADRLAAEFIRQFTVFGG